MEELEPIRERRRVFEKDIPALFEMLKEGSLKAREVAAQTLAQVKSAMKIDYFNDKELVDSLSQKFRG